MRIWLYAAVVAVLMAVVAVGTVRSGLVLRTWIPGYNLLLNRADNLLRLFLLGLCLAAGAALGPGSVSLGWDTGGLAGDLVVGVVCGLVLALALSVAGSVAVRRWGQEIYSNKMVQCILPLNRGEWAGVLVVLLPAAALEELLFRSLPLGGLGWLVAPWWLLWPLALLFGLLHWPQGWWGVVGTSLAGIILSLLFLASGSIWIPLVAHYVMNVTQLLLARWTGVKPLRSRL